MTCLKTRIFSVQWDSAIGELRGREKTDRPHYEANMSQSGHVAWRHESNGKRTDEEGRHLYDKLMEILKNIAQVEHSRHRTFDNFIVNLLSAIAAYCCFPKKPCINVTRTIDTQLSLF